jgi:hypothetical protein
VAFLIEPETARDCAAREQIIVDRNVRSTLIQDVFTRYMLALGEFFAVVERCAIKGWPDRAAAIGRHIEVQRLFRDEEVSRLKYILGSDSDVVLESYCRIDLIRQRLRAGWTAGDEEALRASDPAYAALEERIQTATSTSLDPTGLDGPLEMAKKDYEVLRAIHTLKETYWALDRQLDQ